MVAKAKSETEKFFKDKYTKTFSIMGHDVDKDTLKELAKIGKPVNDYDMTYELYQGSVERFYFWLIDQLKWDMSYKVYKLEDNFMTSITSSFWGSIEQRRSTQQEKVSQYLGLIANMIKSLFQILRSLRIMEERQQYYIDSKNGDKSAEIALKGLWVDLVEGGGKNPASVYALAAQVGFVTLPDLFFDITPKNKDDVDRVVDAVDINKKVKEVLKRKLKQFMLWKESTEKEMTSSKTFHLKYLRQHFNTIRLYMTWIKPYLKNIQKLKQQGKRTEDILEISDIAINDIEIFATKDRIMVVGGDPLKRREARYPSYEYLFQKYFPVIRLKFEYRTVPDLAYHQEYQRGAVHMGYTHMIYESYVLTRPQIEAYMKSKELEDIDLLEDINESMVALKDDLIKYLKEADELDVEKKLGIKKKEEKQKDMLSSLFKFDKVFEPFVGVVDFLTLKPFRKKDENGLKTADDIKKLTEPKTYLQKKEKDWAKTIAELDLWGLYDVFKKAHQLIRW